MVSTPPVKIVKASAGSGKTFQLTAHYIALLFKENTSFSHILAITFTNKATAEMKHRILTVLESLAQGNDRYTAYQDVILALNPELSPIDIKEKAKQIYRQILHRYGLFHVTTIDGFVQKVIRSFSYELEIGSAYRLEMNLDKVKKDLSQRLNKILNTRADLLKWIINYAREQIEKGRHWNYTHTLLELANEIFKERYQPFHDAMRMMKAGDRSTIFETVDTLNKEQIAAFEQAFVPYFREAKNTYLLSGANEQDLAGKSRNPLAKLATWDESTDPFALYGKLVSLIDMPEKWQKSFTPTIQGLYDTLNPLLKRLQQWYEEQAPAYYLALALNDNMYYLNLLQEMSNLLSDYRNDHGVMLISESQSLLKEINKTGIDNASFIWEKVGTHFKHLLFDEFQDTSSSQWYNFVPLLSNMLAEHPAKSALADHLIVGDIKQSIYRWRSGDWTLLDRQVAADLGQERIAEHSLQENYRSRDNIIDFNNFLFKHGPKWLQDELNEKVRQGIGEEAYLDWWQKEGFDQQIIRAYQTSFQHKPARKDGQNAGGHVAIKVLPLEKGNRSSRQNQTKEQALEQLGTTLLTWIQERRYLPKQIGILVRTNQEAQDVIQHLLAIQQALPAADRFNVVSGEALLLANNRSVKLIINSLMIMITPPSDAAIFKANCLYLFHQQADKPFTADNSLWFGLHEASIHHWGKTLPQLLKDQWDSIQQQPLSELVEFLIRAYQLDAQEADIPYLLAFKDLVEKCVIRGEQSIPAFLDYWNEDGQKKALPAAEGTNAIEILTIHKSKGLAFDVVMIPFCSWNLDTNHLRDFWIHTADTPYSLLQSVPVKYNANKIGKSSLYRAFYEEMLFNFLDALNLLYVATTRTKEELYITVPDETTTPNLIADLLIQVVKQFHNELGVNYDAGIAFPPTYIPVEKQANMPVKEINRKGVHLRQVDDNWTWSLCQYPSSNHLHQALESQKIKTELLLLGEQDPNIRLGLMLHEVLSKINHPEGILQQLRYMQSSGTIKASETAFLSEKLHEIFAHPDLKEIWQKEYAIVSERSILHPDGRVFRPDKVFLGPNETLILDFKFTGKKDHQFVQKEHLQQVGSYRQLLSQMGYPNVQGYLYYAFAHQLILVQ